MSQSANDWASPDPSQNIILADADRFNYGFASLINLSFVSRFVLTTSGTTVSESQLRAFPMLVTDPVNLYGSLTAANTSPTNIAKFVAAVRAAGASNDPIGALTGLLQPLMPQIDVPSLFTRIPAVQQLVGNSLQGL